MNMQLTTKALLLSAFTSFALCAVGCGGTSDQQGDAEGTSSEQSSQGLIGTYRVGYWNYVCTSSASMWSSPSESGNATWELAGAGDITPAPVYVHNISRGVRDAQVTAIIPTRRGTPWPGKYIDGYLNAINLCACPTNSPHQCSAY
jgi:hypothetical protein